MSDATTLDAPGGPPAAPDLAYLIVRRGDRGEVLDLDDNDEIVIGRGAEATLRLDDAQVSRAHARVERRRGALRLVDLGSRNGTRVNGDVVRNAARPIRSGDVIRIGEAEIVVAETVATREAATPSQPTPAPTGVVVADPAMVELFSRVRRVAATPATVLVLGETGVGKEVIAEQVHRQSPRAAKPFVRVNCGSLPEPLAESELFGHERGAFTGADRRRPGLLEAAHGGTLFFDEIGELPLPLQAKLLRVLEERRFMRIGSRDELAVDVRFVAATNRDLQCEVRAGRFREDLYFRLSSFVVRVPPLRERPSEIVLLAELFARRFAERIGLPTPTFSAGALRAVTTHAWPGNVRELRNAVEHAVILVDGGVLEARHLPEMAPASTAAAAAPPVGDAPMRDQIDVVEKRAILDALDAEGGNQTRAAARLGISRRALIYKLAKHNIR